MISSPLGLRDVPHVVAPAGIDELARGAVSFRGTEVAPQPIVLVPGVRTEIFGGASGTGVDALPFDVMRGEETLVCGLVAGGHLDAGRGAAQRQLTLEADSRRRGAPRRRQPDVIGGEVRLPCKRTILSACCRRASRSIATA